MSAHDFLFPQAQQIARLRSELRALRGAIGAQQPRMAASHQHLLHEGVLLREDLQQLSHSMDSRQRALSRIRSSQADIDSLAEQVASAASQATARIQADRVRSTTMAERADPRPQRPVPEASREEMLEAARERMRRRGVSSGASSSLGPRELAIAAGRESMFDRLRAVQIAEEDRAKAAEAHLDGEPVVDALTLLRTIKDVCSICLEARKAGERCWVLACGHAFHEPCAQRWLKTSSACPMCKATVSRMKTT